MAAAGSRGGRRSADGASDDSCPGKGFRVTSNPVRNLIHVRTTNLTLKVTLTLTMS